MNACNMNGIWVVCIFVIFCFGASNKAAAADNKEAEFLSNIRQLTFAGKRAGEGYFSADGRRMIFQSERETGNPFYQMYVMDLTTGEVQRVSPGHGKTTCGWLHPGGQGALFASTQDDPNALAKQKAELEFRASGKRRRYSWDYDSTYDIQHVDLKMGRYTNLTNTEGYDAEGAYSPDGQLIVFASNRDAYSRRLTPEEKVLFEKKPSFFMDLYVMNADGSNVRRLTSAPGYDGGPFFSADGKKIVWRRFSKEGAQAEIFTINVDGTDERQITRAGLMSWAPYYHPSGDYIIFSTNKQGHRNFELYLVDAEGKSDPVRVTYSEGFDGLPVFTPDGRSLSWTSKRTSNRTSQIFMANWNDAKARELLGLPTKSSPENKVEKTLPSKAVSIIEKALTKHVNALASDEMEGRLTGTKGERLATNYVAGLFQSLGLKPEGKQNYIDPFTFTAGVSLGSDNALAIHGETRQQIALDKAWRPLAFSTPGKLQPTPVVFAGYGILAPEADGEKAYDSFKDVDLTGKWVLVYRGVPGDISGERRLHLTRFADLRYKASVARSKGAKGLIVAPAPGVKYKDELVRLKYDAVGGVSNLVAISIDNIALKRLLAPVSRDLEKAIDGLEKGGAMRAVEIPGLRLSAQIDVVQQKKTGRNVIARLATGASANTPALIIGAHIDHLGRGETSGSLATDKEKGQVHYGADDNASGVAALLEVAKLLTAKQKKGLLKAKRDIIFAAWSGEELGLIGSHNYVNALAKKTGSKTIEKKVAAYLNMDMVGRYRGKLSLFGIGSSSIWPELIERVNAPIGLTITTSRDSYLPTDATTFYLKGVPILHAFTGTHEDYSTPRDTAEKVNVSGLAAIASLIEGVGVQLARMPSSPDYIEQKAPRSRGARRRSTVYLGTIPDYAREGVKGVLLSGIVKGGPAEQAGLESGDVIVSLDGAAIENIYDYVRVINMLKVGKSVQVTVLRSGQKRDLSVTPAPKE